MPKVLSSLSIVRRMAVSCMSIPLLTACTPRSFAQSGPAASAQPTYTPKLTFEVASIKKSEDFGDAAHIVGGAPRKHDAKLDLLNVPLIWLVQIGYGGLTWQEVSGLPDWTKNDEYTIHAKGDAETEALMKSLPDAEASLELQHMVQALLIERLHFKAHWEQKEALGFALKVGKGGPKFSAAKPDPPAPEGEDASKPKPPALIQKNLSMRSFEFVGHGATMQDLAHTLTVMFGRPVVDQTDLTGTYDFTIQYHGQLEEDPAEPAALYPTLLNAVPEQLGLKLESTRQSMKLLAIDHIEKPTLD